MDKAELTKLLKTPLDPDLDYFDATASIKAMAEHIRDLHKLINYMFESVALQGASILDIREKMVAQKGAIEFLASMVGAEQDKGPLALIGFDKPKIEVPN